MLALKAPITMEKNIIINIRKIRFQRPWHI